MPRSSRRCSPSFSASETSSLSDSSLSASSDEDRRPARPSSRQKGVVYRSLPAQDGQPKKSRTCLWITLAVVVLVLVAGGGAAYYFRDDLTSLFSGSDSAADSEASATSSGSSGSATASGSLTASTGGTNSSSAAVSSGASSAATTSGATKSAASLGSLSASSATASATSSSSFSTSQTYTLAQECTGDSFFSCFSFNTDRGVSSDVAANNGLISVSDGAAYLRLDSWNDYTADDGNTRPKLYLEMAQTQFRYGLVVAAVTKMPFGCGVWSSLFTYGGDWPNGGGFDILEGISLQSQSTPTVVASDDQCKIGDQDSMTGTPVEGQTDCSASEKSDSKYVVGCSVENSSKGTYGQGWNEAGGGILAALVDTTGIYIWQFASAAAATLDLDNPNPTEWGKPVAAWPASTCSTDYFTEQTLAISLGVCGTRVSADWSSSCSDVADSCDEYVLKGANLEDMVWQFDYIRMFAIEGGSSASGSAGKTGDVLSTSTVPLLSTSTLLPHTSTTTDSVPTVNGRL
ncbi:hypothetical protein JCM10207_006505 [Rhodosporidiobolus poonsookiae]